MYIYDDVSCVCYRVIMDFLFIFIYWMFQRDYVARHMGTQMYSNDKKLFSTTRKGKILPLYYKKVHVLMLDLL